MSFLHVTFSLMETKVLIIDTFSPKPKFSLHIPVPKNAKNVDSLKHLLKLVKIYFQD